MKRYHVQNERMRLSMAGLPAVLGFLCLYIVPVGMTIWYSFLENSFTMIFAGVDNYLYIWANEYFQLAVRNTICLTVTLVASAAMVSVIIGYLHHRYTKSNGAGTLFLLLPLLIPSGAVVSIWKTVFSTSSFSGTMQSYAAITSLFVWKYAGFGAVLIDTGLQRIPNEISQAAEIDGAGAKKIYTRIHLPILGKDLGLLILFLLMFAFRIYKESYLLFGEYPCDAMYLVQHYMNNHFLKMNFQNVSPGTISFAFLMFFIYGIVYWLMQENRRNTL